MVWRLVAVADSPVDGAISLPGFRALALCAECEANFELSPGRVLGLKGARTCLQFFLGFSPSSIGTKTYEQRSMRSEEERSNFKSINMFRLLIGSDRHAPQKSRKESRRILRGYLIVLARINDASRSVKGQDGGDSCITCRSLVCSQVGNCWQFHRGNVVAIQLNYNHIQIDIYDYLVVIIMMTAAIGSAAVGNCICMMMMMMMVMVMVMVMRVRMRMMVVDLHSWSYYRYTKTKF